MGQKQEASAVDLKDLRQSLKKVYSDKNGPEKITVITSDGRMLVFGEGSKHGVGVPLSDIVRQLAYNESNLGKVAAIIHNHNRGEDFSDTDKQMYKSLRDAGFAGKFQSYHPEKERLKTMKITDKKEVLEQLIKLAKQSWSVK
jgi:hypothetical protein